MPGNAKRRVRSILVRHELMLLRIVERLERLIARLEGGAMPGVRPSPDIENEVLSALIGLGHKRAEAKEKLRRALATGQTFATAEELLKEVYKH